MNLTIANYKNVKAEVWSHLAEECRQVGTSGRLTGLVTLWVVWSPSPGSQSLHVRVDSSCFFSFSKPRCNLTVGQVSRMSCSQYLFVITCTPIPDDSWGHVVSHGAAPGARTGRAAFPVLWSGSQMRGHPEPDVWAAGRVQPDGLSPYCDCHTSMPRIWRGITRAGTVEEKGVGRVRVCW